MLCLLIAPATPLPDVALGVCSVVKALPSAEEAEAGGQSTPGLRTALRSAAEAPEKAPSAAGGPSTSAGQPLLTEADIEEIPSSSAAVTVEERYAAGDILLLRICRLMGTKQHCIFGGLFRAPP